MLQKYEQENYTSQMERVKHFICDNADRISEVNDKYCTKLILYFIGSRVIKESENFAILYIETFKHTEINFFCYFEEGKIVIYFFEENQGNLCRFTISKNETIFEISNVTGQDNTIECKRGLLNDLIELFNANNFLEGMFNTSYENWNNESQILKEKLDIVFKENWYPDELLKRL